ncbi:DUF1016 N-terminal domain-containing protein [uncultured Methanospirillum sp.]|uniref:DUF1016 N-terminal domain-containing protein n=1 Tax=uncultured Methanospirillum sp. TaxID=262503 RepID=UPI0029C7CC29|nr:DUF1016 N-terminal domain-containing protein [uncultured Methanospirillum sp.]
MNWGVKVIDKLSQDLRKEFPDMKGFSVRNLKYMQTFGAAYPDHELVQEVLTQLTWFHICPLITRIKKPDERVFYLKKTIEHVWSRSILTY